MTKAVPCPDWPGIEVFDRACRRHAGESLMRSRYRRYLCRRMRLNLHVVPAF